jgi:hypothetical protein
MCGVMSCAMVEWSNGEVKSVDPVIMGSCAREGMKGKRVVILLILALREV